MYPKKWAEAILCAIHKQGSHDDMDNYRGISLLVVCSKILTKVFNNRIFTWSEEMGKIHESQGGFRKGRSTVDHIFTLNALTEKYLSKKGGRLYLYL